MRQPPRPPSDDERIERTERTEQRLDDLEGRILAALGETTTALQSLDKRMSRVEIRLEAALDKERAITDAKFEVHGARHNALKRDVDAFKRDYGRRLEELDKDVEVTGEHGRETLSSVQRVVARQEAENAARIAADKLERATAEVADLRSKLAAKHAATTSWVTWAVRGLIGGALVVTIGLIAWLLVHLIGSLTPPPQQLTPVLHSLVWPGDLLQPEEGEDVEPPQDAPYPIVL